MSQPPSDWQPWAGDDWPGGFSNLFRTLLADMDRFFAGALGAAAAGPAALPGLPGSTGAAGQPGLFGLIGLPGLGEGLTPGAGPAIQIDDAGAELVIRAQVSGLDPTRLDVRMGPQMFYLQGEIQHTYRQEHPSGLTQAASWSSVTRSQPLPVPVDPGRAVLATKDGILEVRVPKLQQLPFPHNQGGTSPGGAV